MFRSAAVVGRAILRPRLHGWEGFGLLAAAAVRKQALVRFSSTPKQRRVLRPRGFRSWVLRWGLAVGGVYYYMTGGVFAGHHGTDFNALATSRGEDGEEEDEDAVLPHSQKALDDESLRRRTATTTTTTPALPQPASKPTPPETPADTITGASTSAKDLEAEGEKEGAFNPDTGEINWDCPCLGGMAHGPCGEEFKSAFSCFVYSTAEPKGVDCIDMFKNMQDCFRKFPEVYASDIETEGDQAQEGEAGTAVQTPDGTASTKPTTPTTPTSTTTDTPLENIDHPKSVGPPAPVIPPQGASQDNDVESSAPQGVPAYPPTGLSNKEASPPAPNGHNGSNEEDHAVRSEPSRNLPPPTTPATHV